AGVRLAELWLLRGHACPPCHCPACPAQTCLLTCSGPASSHSEPCAAPEVAGGPSWLALGLAAAAGAGLAWLAACCWPPTAPLGAGLAAESPPRRRASSRCGRELAMAARPALGLAEPQVLIDFPGDAAGHRWHHRLLLIQTPTPGVWIASAPDYSVHLLDLNAHRVVALPRNGPFPAAQRHESYIFDNPVPAADLARIAQQVPADPAAFVTPDAAGDEDYLCGLVVIDNCWTFCQLVADADKDAWEIRDPLTGQRLASFVDSLALQYAATDPPFPLGGHRVAHEYMRTLRATGMEWVTHHLDFVHKSGISPNSNVASTHRRLTDALHAFQQQDMLNLP
ncbi:unnamed protein product, partial [Prorocentrum cordatum]